MKQVISPELLLRLWQERGLFPPEDAIYTDPETKTIGDRMRAVLAEIESIEKALIAHKESETWN